MMVSYVAEIRRLSPSSAEEGYPEKEVGAASGITGPVGNPEVGVDVGRRFSKQEGKRRSLLPVSSSSEKKSKMR
jgi:hypothetical protein